MQKLDREYAEKISLGLAFRSIRSRSHHPLELDAHNRATSSLFKTLPFFLTAHDRSEVPAFVSG